MPVRQGRRLDVAGIAEVADIDDLAKKNIQGVNFVVQMTTADLQNVAALTASARRCRTKSSVS